MDKYIKKIWSDPVWSKVIAQTIISVLGIALLALFKSIYESKNITSSVLGLLTYKVELWIFLLILLIVFVITFLLKSKTFGELNVEKCNLRITNLINDSKIVRIQKVEGSFEYLPANAKIRFYVTNSRQSLCWINTETVLINQKEHKWESIVYFGNEEQKKEIFYLVLVLEEDVLDHWVKHYKESSSRTNHWHPFNYPLPSSSKECQKIKVQRIE